MERGNRRLACLVPVLEDLEVGKEAAGLERSEVSTLVEGRAEETASESTKKRKLNQRPRDRGGGGLEGLPSLSPLSPLSDASLGSSQLNNSHVLLDRQVLEPGRLRRVGDRVGEAVLVEARDIFGEHDVTLEDVQFTEKRHEESRLAASGRSGDDGEAGGGEDEVAGKAEGRQTAVSIERTERRGRGRREKRSGNYSHIVELEHPRVDNRLV